MLSNIMEFVEQYANGVNNCSSRYNNSNSVSYSPHNLPGHPSKYPNYGDYPDTYILRTYGRWWKNSEGAPKDYRPQDVDDVISEDYVELSFEYAVIPTNLIIYETYNPGAVVRIFGRGSSPPQQPWTKLYEGRTEVCPDEARRFEPPLKPTKNLINEIRIEFNQSLLKYHTAIDAVLLAGYKLQTALQLRLLENDIFRIHPPQQTAKRDKFVLMDLADGIDYFTTLPHEVVVRIFQYLDLKSLTRCAQVNKRWNEITLDPSLYQALSLKKYWHLVDDRTMMYYEQRCFNLRKLDMTWCDDRLSQRSFVDFIRRCGFKLTHASFSCKNCTEIFLQYVINGVLDSSLIELRLSNCDANSFSELFGQVFLTNLVVLDLSATKVSDQPLISILQSNRNLKHLNINLCEELKCMDVITNTISFSNLNLETFSAWKTTSLTAQGVMHLGRCKNLRELDLGWCLMTTDPTICLDMIAMCCRDLRRLIVSNWRGLYEHHLMGILGCTELRQLDLMGIKGVTYDFCRMALTRLTKLELLEISFCDGIEALDVNCLRNVFKHVVIQRSCEFSANDHWN